MKRALGPCLAAVLLIACGDRVPTDPFGRPLAAISDGRTPAGNPDFFWLPPVASDPSGEPNYDAAEFNPNLAPGVAVCRLANPSAGDAAVCEAGPLVLDSAPAALNATGEFYYYHWETSSSLSSADTLRVFAFVGSTELGFVDVTPQANGAKNVKTDEFFQFNDGRIIPLKFRIETAALCYALDEDFRDPGAGRDPNEPCVSATLAAGGSLVLETETEGEVLATVTVHDGENGGSSSTITMKRCKPGRNVSDFIDLPTFGDCVDIETDPPLPEVSLTGIATLCQALDEARAEGLSEDQVLRIVGHNLTDAGFVVALPEADGFCPEPTSPGPGPGLGLGPLDELIKVAGTAWQAARRVVAWVKPASLWATLICDRGCGWEDWESPVEAALPAQMDFHPDNPDGDLGSHRVNTTLSGLKVAITDAGGDPVAGATVSLVTSGGGSVDPATFTTGTDGIVTFSWTLSEEWGVNTVTVSGRGIADPSCASDEDAPCGPDGVYAPDHTTGADPVKLGTGSLTFTALAVDADLVVESLTHSPADPNSLDLITFTAVVKNQGPGPAEATTLEFRIGGETPGAPETQFAVPALDANQTFEVQRQATLPPQNYINTAVADVNDDVPERLGPPDGETNNVTTDTYTVTQPPDLVVETLTHDPASPVESDLITFTAVVTNQGPGPSRATTLEFRIGGETPGALETQFAVPALAAGATFPVERQATLTAQGYQNTAVADVNGDVPETDETNNQTVDLYTVSHAVAVAIDGAIGSGEWDGATTYDFEVNTPEGTTTPGQLFVRNDGTNLYLAVRFARTVVDPGNSASFEFDSDGSGTLNHGDDGIILNPSSGFQDLVRQTCGGVPCSRRDTDVGGTNDGAAAFANDGTHTVYEFSHPLNSGDAFDFARASGQTLGLSLSIRMIAEGAEFPSGFGDTTFPATGFLQITIQ